MDTSDKNPDSGEDNPLRDLTGDIQKGLSWGSNGMRYYRLLGNKLKETCDLNTGIRVREQHAREE
jgi:hypothetical protein